MIREEAIAFWKKKKNKAHPCDVEYYDMAIQALSQEPTSPCDVCRYNPPSSTDGKPCTMCPAEGRTE